MRTKIFMLALAACGLAFTGCDGDDDNIGVPQLHESAFDSRYPGATRVSWEKKGDYFVADFLRADMNAEAEAWFDVSAQWLATVTEIAYDQFPQPVKDAFAAGDYAAWRIDDTDFVERDGMESLYVIEVEQGGQEYDLFYTADGTLVKEALDVDGNADNQAYIPGDVSSQITEYISANHPKARIVEIENERNGIEVDIIDETVHRELLFTSAGEWMRTKTETVRSEVPETVMAAFNASEYSSLRIDDVDLCNTPDGDFYLFELDAEPKDVMLKIFPDGTIETM